MAKFEPGKSGNPNGRPKQKPFLDWCKKWVDEKGESQLCKIAENGRHKQQLEAIKTIFAYAIGKPVEYSETSHQFDGLAPDPSKAKELLEQIIGESEGSSILANTGSAASAGEKPAELPDPQRSAGAGDQGDRPA